MKQFILPVLWTLAIGSTFAQKTLSPSLQRHAETWPQSVKKAMREMGFDAQPLSPNTVQARFDPSRLDSTKTFFGYEPSGIGGDSTPQYRTTYQYPQNGLRIETASEFLGGVWTLTTRTSNKVDALNRTVEVVAERYDSAEEDWVFDSKSEVWLRENSVELADSLRISTWNPDTETWHSGAFSKNIFDAQNRLQKVETTFDADGQTALFVDDYYYNSSGDNHLIESFMSFGGFLLPMSKRDMAYSNHRLLQVIVSSPNVIGGGFTPSSRTTMAYNSQNLVKQTNQYEWVPGLNDWNPVNLVKSEYDSALRLTSTETETFFPGEPSALKRITYTYREGENLALRATYDWDHALNQYALTEREFYYYTGGSSSVRPMPHEAQTLGISPNPADGAVRLAVEAEAEIRVFDAAGRLMQSQVVQPGESLDLTALPAGVYTVIAQNEAAARVGKLVKQ